MCRENPRQSGILLFPDRPRFYRLMKTRNGRHPDLVGWTGTNLENRERFYFPDASQTSAMVGDHSQQMKPQICTVGDVGVRRRWISSLITNPLNCWAPVPLSQINMASFSTSDTIGKIWDRPLAMYRPYIGKIWDGQQKLKFPIDWDFNDI